MRYEINLSTGETQELPDPPPVVAAPLSDAEFKDAIRFQIILLEQSQLMPRATREFMLLMMESQFPAESLAANPGYSAVKAFDNEIKALRDQL